MSEALLDALFKEFESHLDHESNSKIFFSGKFGIGKTTFLKKFFTKNDDKYYCFHLYPVNYQISSNDDIIDYLKYDLLVDLISKNEGVLREDDFGSFIDLQRLLYLYATDNDNLKGVFTKTIETISKLQKPLEATISVISSFLKFKEKIEKYDSKKIEEFLKETKARRILEPDLVSNLLKEKISTEKGEKKSVLIIDDLDRIDPKQLFRILNVFSAHFDLPPDNQENKFGFDKIILTGDVKNIKSIFHHFYGSETDFNGYFDKFFSKEIFELNNQKIIQTHLFSSGEYKQLHDLVNYLAFNALNNDLECKLTFRRILKRSELPVKYTLSCYNNSELIENFKGLIEVFGDFDFVQSLINEVRESEVYKGIDYKKFIEIFQKYLVVKSEGDIKSLPEELAKQQFFDLFIECIKKYKFSKIVNKN